MNEIITHRASYNGLENTIEGIKHFKNLGVGVELDLRYGKNGIYMSHDPQDGAELFETACKLLTDSKIKIALHIKEIKVVNETLKLLKKYSISNYFLFNTEMINFSQMVKEYEIAEYVNQKPIDIKQKMMWCDETKNKWYNKKDILAMHKKNKVLYAMSYEVVNENYTKNEMFLEWKRLIELGFDGICTKYPEKLIEYAKRGDLD